ncbi:MAG: hypothetical protein K9K32_03165 [Halanaerobiales bacterium]|nr:hypothetical protein [Halanaerobiales bacterium]
MHHYGFRFIGPMGGGVFMIIFAVLVIAGIFYLIMKTNNNYKTGDSVRYNNNGYKKDFNHNEKRFIDIAKERYARGEIDKDKLQEILRELQG